MIQRFTAKKQTLILDDFVQQKHVFFSTPVIPSGVSHNPYLVGFNPVIHVLLQTPMQSDRL